MDSLIAAAGRALAAGDVLVALKHVALRADPPALALRGIAMARLGELGRARELLRAAARGFGAHEPVARARCQVADAEVALALRELGTVPRALATAAATLERHGDHANALHARLLAARRLLLLGRVDEATGLLEQLDTRAAPATLQAVASLARAEALLRSLRIGAAEAALAHAHDAAARAGVPALMAEVAELGAALQRPAARVVTGGSERRLQLAEVAALLATDVLVVDACRRGLRHGSAWLSLARRPLLFALLRALAEAWPGDVARTQLIAEVFRTRRPDETHRARLRVEIGRLRRLLVPFAGIIATQDGFALAPHDGREVAVLAPPLDGEQASLQALLADGAAWSTSALALALGTSQRTVQRALQALAAAGQVRAVGQARAQRWVAPPLAGFTTFLLLPDVPAAG